MTTNRHTFQVQRVLTLTGPLMVVLWMAGFIAFAKFIPVPSPEPSPERVVDKYHGNTTSIRVGLCLTLFGAALLVPFAAAIYSQLKRIEGDRAPLAVTQLCSAALLSVEFIIPVMVWQTAAYRPDQDSARLIQALNDMGWLMFVGVISSVMMQFAAIGYAILIDDRPEPVFPRWCGYLNVWAVLLVSPAGVVPFFKNGPLAWNGIFAFYIPLSVFFVWLIAMVYLLWKAIAQEQTDAANSGGPNAQ